MGVVIQANTGSDGLRGVVAIGASAGGVEALSNLAAGLSPDLPYTYLIALRMPVAAPSVLARIVDRKGPPLSTLYLPGRGSRTRAERAQPAPGGQRSRAG